MTRPIFLLTDFGLADAYVGVVKAVILGIAPNARIVDLTHDVPPQDVRAGAFALLTAAPYLPSDAVVLAVVDPGVGTARRPVAVQVRGRVFVGPDNGLLSWAIHPTRDPASTSTAIASSAVVLDRPDFWLPALSSTFHGRDLFGPVAAHLARGVPLNDLGSPVDDLVTLAYPGIHSVRDRHGSLVAVRGELLHVDRYGNLISNLAASDLPPDPTVQIGGRRIAGLSPHYQASTSGASSSDADVSRRKSLVALIGSAGLLEVAVPNGSAASALGVGVGATIEATGPDREVMSSDRRPQR